MPSLYDIPCTTLAGEPATLADYKGKVLLIVNVASKCGYTPQYTGLQKLYTDFADRGLVVLGFPANDFANQEPGTDADIASFCSTTYPVTFPMFSKCTVTGEGKHPLFRALTTASPSPTIGNGDVLRAKLSQYASANGLPAPNNPPEILWNFEKFLVSRQGDVVARIATDVVPDDPRLVSEIEVLTA